ncbi:MAG TPA: efflux RND transporter periplasmic adaptor subunit, partial [Allosphingosinicella sp.]
MNFETASWRRSAIEGDPVEVDVDALAQRRKRRRIIIAVAVALILAAAAVFFMTREKPASDPAAGGAAEKALPAVTVVVPGRQQVSRAISATGTLAARRDMPVGIAGEGGMVARVLVEPGQWVGAGQTLAVIERSVQAQEAQQLAASIEVARADARLAQQELDRAQALVSRGFVSKADVERRIATRDAANA